MRLTKILDKGHALPNVKTFISALRKDPRNIQTKN